jgi:hypothetical protein
MVDKGQRKKLGYISFVLIIVSGLEYIRLQT